MEQLEANCRQVLTRNLDSTDPDLRRSAKAILASPALFELFCLAVQKKKAIKNQKTANLLVDAK